MDTDEVRITLRLPEKLHQHLKQAAEKDKRSLNSEIIFILEQWVEEQGRQQDG